MKDPVVMSHVNMWAVLKSLEPLCALDETAKALASPKKPMSIGFHVQGGPMATLHFSEGVCRMSRGNTGMVKLLLPSPQAFNAMVDGDKNPLPYSGLTKVRTWRTGPSLSGAPLSSFTPWPLPLRPSPTTTP